MRNKETPMVLFMERQSYLQEPYHSQEEKRLN